MIWKTSEKKNETEVENKTQGNSRRLEQAEGRISELEDEWKLKEKLKNSNNSRPMKGICKNSLTPQKTKPENHGY
jgi:hypothetical protein